MSTDSPADREIWRSAAAHWFSEHRAGTMTEEDRRLFTQWLSQAPENRAAYRQLEQTWALLDTVAQDPQILAAREQDRQNFDKPSRLRRAALVAAAILLAVTTSWTVIDSGLVRDLGFTSHTETAIYRTRLGQRLTFLLSDGSSVSLDSDSKLRVGDMYRHRQLELLRGRAFFNVVADPARPFSVRAGARTVRALGTAFQVSMAGEDVTVTLVEGVVRVEADSELLQPDPPRVDMRQAGRQLSAPQDAGNWVVEQVDVQAQTSWLDGHLVFLRKPLVEAVAEINRYTKQQIIFSGHSGPDPEIFGVFRTGDADSFVRALELDGIARVVSRSADRVEMALLTPQQAQPTPARQPPGGARQ